MIIFWFKKGCGGYGDRLVGLGACIAIAQALNHKLKIIWDEDVSSLFHDYISSKPLPTYDFHYNWVDNRSPGACMLAYINPSEWENKCIMIESNQPVHRFLMHNKYLDIKSYADLTRNAYNKIYSDYLVINQNLVKFNVDNHIGIQIRCGDAYLTGNERLRYIANEELPKKIEAIREYINKETSIYVTTDYSLVYDLFNKVFEPSKIVYYDGLIEHFDNNPSVSSVVKTILEHYTLSRCEHIITYRHSSNFGVTAALCGNMKKVINMIHCGRNRYLFDAIDYVTYPYVKATVPEYLWSFNNIIVFPTEIKSEINLTALEKYQKGHIYNGSIYNKNKESLPLGTKWDAISYNWLLNNTSKYNGSLDSCCDFNSPVMVLTLPENNYFQWWINVVPQYYMIKDTCINKEIPKLISLHSFNKPYQMETLKMLNIKIEHVTANTQFTNELYCAKLLLNNYTVKCMEKFRDEILKLNNNTLAKRNLIYITNNKISNQETLIPILKKLGFEIVDICQLNIQEQIILFYNARLILGLSDDYMVNIGFSDLKTCLIELLPTECQDKQICYKQMCDYKKINHLWFPIEKDGDLFKINNDIENFLIPLIVV